MNRFKSFLVCVFIQTIMFAQTYSVYPPTHTDWTPIGHKIAVLHRFSDDIIYINQVKADGLVISKARKIKGPLQCDYTKNHFVIVWPNDQLSCLDCAQNAQTADLLKNQQGLKTIKENITPDSAFVAIYIDDVLRYYATPVKRDAKLNKFFNAYNIWP